MLRNRNNFSKSKTTFLARFIFLKFHEALPKKRRFSVVFGNSNILIKQFYCALISQIVECFQWKLLWFNWKTQKKERVFFRKILKNYLFLKIGTRGRHRWKFGWYPVQIGTQKFLRYPVVPNGSQLLKFSPYSVPSGTQDF